MQAVDTLIEKVQRIIAGFAQTPSSSELAAIIREQAGVISDEELIVVLRRLRSDSVGVGSLEALLSVPGVTDILVNHPDSVWIDRGCGLEKTSVQFASEAEVRGLAVRLALQCGRRLDDAQPFADGRITRDDGNLIRIHAILPPLAESGTCISLRVLRQARHSLGELVQDRTIPSDLAEPLRRLILDRRSFLVAGGTGSGKTTLLSALLTEIPHDQRVICIEDTAELHPNHPGIINLVSRTTNVEGAGGIAVTELLKQALRMRPDRIIVGEIRGAEVIDLLAALNTGHDGGAGTVHANSITEIPARMEALAARGGMNRDALHTQLSAAVDVVLIMRHTEAGRRLAQIGVLQGNPVVAQVVWDIDNSERLNLPW